MDAIIVALITGGCSLIGVFVSNLMTSKKTETSIQINQAVTNTKLENITSGINELQRDVRNNKEDTQNLFERVIKVEQSTKSLHKRVDAIETHEGRCKRYEDE